ncbi:hypothetical protein L209DRAFT_750976 [Thermothelomyces heterothallicus CBS 203.75]
MTTSSSSSLSSSPTSSSQEPSPGSAASSTGLEVTSQPTSSTATAPHDSASTSDSEASLTVRNSGSSVNTAAIVGGVVGCVALICACLSFLSWMRHRSRSATAAATAPSPPPSPDYKTMMMVEAASRPMIPPVQLSQVMMPAEMPGEWCRYN